MLNAFSKPNKICEIMNHQRSQLEDSNLIKMENLEQVFSYEFWGFLKKHISLHF